MTVRILNHHVHTTIVLLAMAEFAVLAGSVLAGVHLFPTTEAGSGGLVALTTRAGVYATAIMLGLVSMGL